MEKLTSIEEFQNVCNSNAKFLIIKHSITCPISQEAFDEFNSFANDYTGDCYYLHVQDARPLSNYIAESYGVKHESPQALLIENNQVVWNASHWNITAKKLKAAIE